jgi:hypothetical protein
MAAAVKSYQALATLLHLRNAHFMQAVAYRQWKRKYRCSTETPYHLPATQTHCLQKFSATLYSILPAGD